MPTDALVHVVDDDLAVRQALAFLLAADGLAVRVHESANAYLDAVTGPGGCIVTDVRMPEVDGIEFYFFHESIVKEIKFHSDLLLKFNFKK